MLGVQAQEPFCLLKQYQPLMVEISLYHYLKPKDVQTAQDLERLESVGCLKNITHCLLLVILLFLVATSMYLAHHLHRG